MAFTIEVTYQRKRYRMQVVCVYADKAMEHFRVSAGGRSVVVQSNRPLFLSKGLKHRKHQWKVVEGSVLYFRALEQTLDALEKVLGTTIVKPDDYSLAPGAA
jgi:hypothetical protein